MDRCGEGDEETIKEETGWGNLALHRRMFAYNAKVLPDPDIIVIKDGHPKRQGAHLIHPPGGGNTIIGNNYSLSLR